MAIDQQKIQLASDEFAFFCQQLSERIDKDETPRLQSDKDELRKFIGNQAQAQAESVATINEMFSKTDAAIDKIFNDPRLTHQTKMEDIAEHLSSDWGRLLLHEEAVNGQINKQIQGTMAQMELTPPAGFDSPRGELRLQEIRRAIGAKLSDLQFRYQLAREYEERCRDLQDQWFVHAVEIRQEVPYLAIMTADEIEKGQETRRKAMYPADDYRLQVFAKRRESFKTLMFRARRELLQLGYFNPPQGTDAELQAVATAARIRQQNNAAAMRK